VLASDFRFLLPGLGGRTLDRTQFFDLVFQARSFARSILDALVAKERLVRHAC